MNQLELQKPVLGDKLAEIVNATVNSLKENFE